MAHRGGPVGRLVRDAARVEPPDEPGFEDLDSRPGVEWDAQRASEISAGAERNHRQLGRRRDWRAVAKEAVDDLVQSAVATHCDDDRPRLLHGALRDLGRLERARGAKHFVWMELPRLAELDL